MTPAKPRKADIQKLQRAIVNGLEDVKAQDIRVFNTEHLSPLFERVVIASGTSNRQTKALAASVSEAVREAGFAKPRTEGEENGEWIIVDCGQAVVHVMQPTIRAYYNLEEIWGGKVVRLKATRSPAASAQTAAVASASPTAASTPRSPAPRARKATPSAVPSSSPSTQASLAVPSGPSAAPTVEAVPASSTARRTRKALKSEAEAATASSSQALKNPKKSALNGATEAPAVSRPRASRSGTAAAASRRRSAAAPLAAPPAAAAAGADQPARPRRAAPIKTVVVGAPEGREAPARKAPARRKPAAP